MRILPQFLLVVLAASTIAAQAQAPSPVQGAWLSLGLGPAIGGAALSASGWYSRGALVVGGRAAGAGALFGDQVADKSLLIGARTKSSDFMLAAIGVGRARFARTSSDVAPEREPTRTALAFELRAELAPVAGLAGSVFGVIGPDRTHYLAAALTLNFGSR